MIAALVEALAEIIPLGSDSEPLGEFLIDRVIALLSAAIVSAVASAVAVVAYAVTERRWTK